VTGASAKGDTPMKIAASSLVSPFATSARSSAQPLDEATEHPATSSATRPSIPSSTPRIVPYKISVLEVLQRPVEYSQFTSWAFTNKIRTSGMMPSFGSVGDGLDNAMDKNRSGPRCRLRCSIARNGRPAWS
jgi:hypothetical protein